MRTSSEIKEELVNYLRDHRLNVEVHVVKIAFEKIFYHAAFDLQRRIQSR